MVDVPSPASVSVSPPLGTETGRHPVFRRDSGATIGETAGLKALAQLVLARDGRRDSELAGVSRCRRESELWARHPETPRPPVETAPASMSDDEAERAAIVGHVSAFDERLSASLASWSEAEEERAAIVEHGVKMQRAWADGFARLHPNRPPTGVPLRRWLTFIDDIGRFLDSPFCAVAAALGWRPCDLFGCDRDRPFARIDCAGRLWLLNGDRLIVPSENTATIETRTGARQTYRRRAAETGRVAWELAP